MVEQGSSSQKLACNGLWTSACNQLDVNNRKIELKRTLSPCESHCTLIYLEICITSLCFLATYQERCPVPEGVKEGQVTVVSNHKLFLSNTATHTCSSKRNLINCQLWQLNYQQVWIDLSIRKCLNSFHLNQNIKT